MQRLRVTFARHQSLKYLSHLDMMRLWHRSLRRAAVPLAYSTGPSPHPRLSLALPLPVGVTAEAELLDLYLLRRMSPFYFLRMVSRQLPHGLEALGAEETSMALPSLQSQVHFADYRVVAECPWGREWLEGRIAHLLSVDSLPWQHLREKEVRQYDLRALVRELRLEEWRGSVAVLGMRLLASEKGTGRPEQVAYALGFQACPASIHRVRLILAHPWSQGKEETP